MLNSSCLFRYRDLIVVDQGENVIIKQVKYAIRKSRKVLGDNTYIGLVIGEQKSLIKSVLSDGSGAVSGLTSEIHMCIYRVFLSSFFKDAFYSVFDGFSFFFTLHLHFSFFPQQ